MKSTNPRVGDLIRILDLPKYRTFEGVVLQQLEANIGQIVEVNGYNGGDEVWIRLPFSIEDGESKRKGPLVLAHFVGNDIEFELVFTK